MSRTNNYEGVLPKLFPGTAKRWYALLYNPDKHFEGWRGAALPSFLSAKEIKQYGLKTMDDVAELLCSKKVPMPRKRGYIPSVPFDHYEPSAYELKARESFLAHMHHLRVVSRTVTTTTGSWDKVMAVRKAQYVVDADAPEEAEDTLSDLLVGYEPLRQWCVLAQDDTILPLLEEDGIYRELRDLAQGDLDLEKLKGTIEESRKVLAAQEALLACAPMAKLSRAPVDTAECLRRFAPLLRSTGCKKLFGSETNASERTMIKKLVDLALGAKEVEDIVSK